MFYNFCTKKDNFGFKAQFTRISPYITPCLDNSHVSVINRRTQLMKKMMRLAAVVLAAMGMASCGSNTCKTNGTSTTTTPAPTAATLTAAFTSPAKMSYSNMRPNYNYYLTTFTFQTLELYSDNTAIFTISASTFSAVVLPEEGNAATANERNNYIAKFYAPFTSEVDDLDEDTVHYTLTAPTRIVVEYDSKYYIDTDNWTDNMKEKSKSQKTEYDQATGQQKVTGETVYSTGAEYLAAYQYKGKVTFTSSTANSSIEYVDDIEFVTALGSAQ